MGEDYFCESGAIGSPSGFYPDDPLWDGMGCSSSSTCCSFNNPPHFTKQLSSPTTDDIEARICHLDGHDTPIEFIELFVKNDEPSYSCGGEGGWRRAVHLNMTDSSTNCPSGWQLTPHSRRTCGKVSSGSLICDSAFFPVLGGSYSKVCGKIKGYQNSRTDAFEGYNHGSQTTIDGAYVGGVSLTHGSVGSREHIWTFAAGASEALPTAVDSCPCDVTISINIPPFVGGEYFCESGANLGSPSGFYPDDPLWDGMGCTSSSTCCSLNDPPYFTKELSSPTNDEIEARICQWDTSDDTPIELIELYVK